MRPFWPGVETESDDDAPPGVIEPPASGGTSYSVSVIEPVALPSGTIAIVYAPATGSVFVSRKPPEVPAYVLPIVPPPGPRSETCAAENETFVIARLTFSPAVPLKRTCGLSPGEVVVTVTGGPPGVMEYAAVALPVTLRVVDRPPTVPVAENVTGPRAAGG